MVQKYKKKPSKVNIGSIGNSHFKNIVFVTCYVCIVGSTFQFAWYGYYNHKKCHGKKLVLLFNIC